jgi:hypothetical protein
VADLEEERRKLRLEMKFRAKYHGAAALELGLSPEQLLLVEQYVDGLRSGRSAEGNLVAQLTKRVGAGRWAPGAGRRACVPGATPPPCSAVLAPGALGAA